MKKVLKPGIKVKVESTDTVQLPDIWSKEKTDEFKANILNKEVEVWACGSSNTAIICKAEEGNYFTIDASEVSLGMTIYIAGPITGIENENIEAFERAEVMLRGLGFSPINPHKLEHKEAKRLEKEGASNEEIWAAYLQEDLTEGMKAGAIFLLDGYEYSKGARLELCVLNKLGKKVYRLIDNVIVEIKDITIEINL